MMDLQVLDALTTHLTRTYPAETTAEVSAVGGLEVHFTTVIEASDNAWEGAVLEFTSGDCTGLSFVVVESHSQMLMVSSPFLTRKPAAGDQVRIWGGPLADMRIFEDDPETLKHAVDEGVDYFATFTVLTGATRWIGLGGRSHKGVEATQRAFGIQISLETAMVTGMPTEADMYRQYTALPILKEQVLLLVQSFRVNMELRMSGEGDIEWNKGFIQRPGTPTMRVYVIDFDLAIN